MIPLDYDMDGDNELNIGELDLMKFDSEDIYIDGGIILDMDDPDIDNDLLLNDDVKEDDDDNDGMTDEYEKKYGCIKVEDNEVDGEGWQNPWVYNARYALIIVGGGTADPPKGNGIRFWKYCTEMYDSLTGDYNYHEENVYLAYQAYYRGFSDDRVLVGEDHSGDERLGGSDIQKGKGCRCYAAWGDLENLDGTPLFNSKAAIIEIGTKITRNDFFFFFEKSHSEGGEGFIVAGDCIEDINGEFPNIETPQKAISFKGLANEIGKNLGGKVVEFKCPKCSATVSENAISCSVCGEYLEDTEKNKEETHIDRKYARACLVLVSCMSGSAMDTNIVGDERIVITATERNQLSISRHDEETLDETCVFCDAYDGDYGTSRGFIGTLKEHPSLSLADAFWQATLSSEFHVNDFNDGQENPADIKTIPIPLLEDNWVDRWNNQFGRIYEDLWKDSDNDGDITDEDGWLAQNTYL